VREVGNVNPLHYGSPGNKPPLGARIPPGDRASTLQMAKITKSKSKALATQQSDDEEEIKRPSHDEGVKARVDQYLRQVSNRSSKTGASSADTMQPSTSQGTTAAVVDVCPGSMQASIRLVTFPLMLANRTYQRPSACRSWERPWQWKVASN
jgi:hypothetical protein